MEYANNCTNTYFVLWFHCDTCAPFVDLTLGFLNKRFFRKRNIIHRFFLFGFIVLLSQRVFESVEPGHDILCRKTCNGLINPKRVDVLWVAMYMLW